MGQLEIAVISRAYKKMKLIISELQLNSHNDSNQTPRLHNESTFAKSFCARIETTEKAATNIT
jgi:hypothetical protein